MPKVQQIGAPSAGVIYGTASSTEFYFAVTDGRLRRLDYVATKNPEGIMVLGQVMQIKRESTLSHQEAVSSAGTGHEPDEKVSAHVKVIGYRDERGLLLVPRTPFSAGAEVSWAAEDLIQKVIGLESGKDSGAYMGTLKGTQLPVHLNVNTLVQKHVSVLAKTGAGKSYCTGVLLEELLKRGVAVVIVDAHDEYHSLAHPAMDADDIDRLLGFGLRPKSFAKNLVTWATALNPRPDSKPLKLEGSGLSANELAELAGGKLTTAQKGILYQAIKDARVKNPLYTLHDVIEMCQANKSNSKWNVVAALETLESTGLFSEAGVEPEKIVQSGKASIVSLKGVAPDAQEIIVARLASILFDARKDQQVPPFLFVVEEAHNYCPERGMGNALSGGVLRTIASEGRKFGMGLAVVTQRPAKVDKNVLSQCNTQIILKVTNPNDLKAIVGSVEGLTSEAADEIARLPVGVALVSGGNLGMPVMLDVRTRQSRHGGAGVDIMGGKEKKTAPKLRTGVDYPSEEELQKAQEAKQQEIMEAEKKRAKEQAKRERSQRPVVWGSHQEEDAIAQAGPRDDEPEKEVQQEDPPQPPAAEPVTQNGDTAHPSELDPEIPQIQEPPVEDPLDRQDRPESENGHRPRPAFAAETRGTGPQPILEPRDVRIHRVANRVGYVQTGRPQETLDLLRRAAARTNVPSSKYTEVFAKVGRTHCHREQPECGPCPLAKKCAYNQKTAVKATPSRGVLARFFTRKP